jgi:hypothetical protein
MTKEQLIAEILKITQSSPELNSAASLDDYMRSDDALTEIQRLCEQELEE